MQNLLFRWILSLIAAIAAFVAAGVIGLPVALNWAIAILIGICLIFGIIRVLFILATLILSGWALAVAFLGGLKLGANPPASKPSISAAPSKPTQPKPSRLADEAILKELQALEQTCSANLLNPEQCAQARQRILNQSTAEAAN